MIDFQVTRYGVLPEQLIQKINIQFISCKDAAKVLGEQSREMMHRHIDDTRQRQGGTGNLQKAINVYVEDVGLTRTVGVGNIAELNSLAPYWYIVNFGGYTTISARGESIYGFYGPGNAPDINLRGVNLQGAKAATEKFTQMPGPADGKNVFRMTPKAPIWPHNYIEKTANWAFTIARIHYSGALNQISLFSRK